jgi:LysR family transcriptional activator of nhaA
MSVSDSTWLNYHHLLYFWSVVREGGVARAAAKLRLSQPTISAQVHQLEAAFGAPLLRREGRGLVMTDSGRVVFRYADEIFGLGRELLETMRGRPAGRPAELTVGVANAVPKLIVYRLLRPATHGDDAMVLVCREGSTEELLGELATHGLDVLITDTPVAPHVRVKVFNHLLGESDTAFFGTRKQAARLRRRFPASLQGEPLLLPTRNTALRRSLDEWFERSGIGPPDCGGTRGLLRGVGRAPGQAPGRPGHYQRRPRRFIHLAVVIRSARPRPGPGVRPAARGNTRRSRRPPPT